MHIKPTELSPREIDFTISRPPGFLKVGVMSERFLWV